MGGAALSKQRHASAPQQRWQDEPARVPVLAPADAPPPRFAPNLPQASRRCRAVISAYFEEKGLVRQQLDSFNDFINSSLQVGLVQRLQVHPREGLHRMLCMRRRWGGVCCSAQAGGSLAKGFAKQRSSLQDVVLTS